MTPTEPAIIDTIDATILELLQKNARTHRSELAEAVGLSLPSVSERLRKLEEGGVITGYAARLDARKLGRDITAFIFVTIDSSKHFGQFLEHAKDVDDIQECHAITGDGSHLLKIRTASTATLEKLLAKIQAWAGVVHTQTHLVLSSAKETARIRVDANK